VIWAIGDIQGCWRTLQRLMRQLSFDDAHDALWLVGDLVNRGPGSLDVLRWARAQSEALGERFIVVLGNHDLHLLACAAGAVAPRSGDTLDSILDAPDRDELIDWLRCRPLLHRATVSGRPHVLVHAGLAPTWTAQEAAERARELQGALSGPQWKRTVAELRRHRISRWHPGLAGGERLAAVAAALTRLRTATEDGRLCLEDKGPPAEAPPGCRPWFELRATRADDPVVVCGHWAALGLHVDERVLSLDSGCVWGGELTAIRLDDRAIVCEPAADGRASD
jgi:bis(5'-nucleosyl)-tetraphosphatase (symmetrical)